MHVIRLSTDMQATALRLRSEGLRIGLVPTMGYLHEGHMALVRRARERADQVVLSLFVNPTQFGPGEDFERYPRDEARDLAMCERESVDFVFAPSSGDLYAPDHSVTVEESVLSAGLCGRTRPGHFRGVATVVAKLFNLALPHVAVFGRKDAQQVRVIQRMVRDLNFPVSIDVAPIVREADGLAMSSRNRYLSEEERRRALCLREALVLAERMVRDGERAADVILSRMRALIREGSPPVDIDYLELTDWDTLQPVAHIGGRCLVALAVRVGRTRLIDNTLVGGNPEADAAV